MDENWMRSVEFKDKKYANTGIKHDITL